MLLADDSAAIRKVIELTFSDEGMEVITVPDGRAAFEKMVQVRPDLVLADVYMPEVDGYELCRSIKQDERFAKTPVMLLISSFEPFDEAEARRAGADDVVTKPFQSIRQLVSRVGSLLNKGESEPPVTDEYPTMEISHTQPVISAAPEELPTEPQVTVLVEAPIMEHSEPAETAGVSCSTDVELQTADTRQLERIVDEPIDEPASQDNLSMEDTIELEPVEAVASHDQVPVEPQPETVEINYSDISEPAVQSSPATPLKLDDAVLDLEDEFLGEPQMVGDDVFLELDFADTPPAEPAPEFVAEEAPSVAFEQAVPVEAAPEFIAEEASAPAAFEQAVPVEAAAEFVAEEAPPVTFEQELAAGGAAVEQPAAPAFDEPPAMLIPEESAFLKQSSPEPVVAPVIEEASAPATTLAAEGLSPAAIDAIARRVVEQMSDKAIREIAWEVVPELSELLIKRKLEEQK